MKAFNEVPIPLWMKLLPLDRRGYPIPFGVVIDKDGRPHFTINDEKKRQLIIHDDLCGICGRKLLKRRSLVGGPNSAFHPHGAYIDPPMHLDCCRYALQVCPYLALSSYNKRLDDKTLDHNKVDEIIVQDNTMNPNRPDLFVMVIFDQQKHIGGEILGTKYVQYIKPVKPYFAVEYWKDGEQLTTKEGLKLARDSLVSQHLKDIKKEES